MNHMIPVSEYNKATTSGQVLIFCPIYPIKHAMRMRIIDAQFIPLISEATYFCPLVDLEPKVKTIYQEHGYTDRENYLIYLAEEYDIDINIVHDMADILGESEEFDGLVSNLEDGDIE